MLRVVAPLMFVCFFGVLTATIVLVPGPFDWRYHSISTLLSPRTDPGHHLLSATGVAVTGVLAFVLGGYIARRLRPAAPIGAPLGALVFDTGAALLIGAAIVVPPASGASSILPRVHDIMARSAGLGITLGLLIFYGCVLKQRRLARDARRPPSVALARTWSVLILPTLIAIGGGEGVRLGARWHIPACEAILAALRHSVAWQLGFWEWVGSALAFALLTSAVLILPEQPS